MVESVVFKPTVSPSEFAGRVDGTDFRECQLRLLGHQEITVSISINGIAHLQMTINDRERGLVFWEKLCHFLEMSTLIRNDDTLYCIGGRTGILVRVAPEETRGAAFDQDRVGLHHLCFRARRREDVDAVETFVRTLDGGRVVHPSEDGSQFAPGYYSVLFEDPDGIRIEVNFVPGKGHFDDAGRLGAEGSGPATRYGEDGLTDE